MNAAIAGAVLLALLGSAAFAVWRIDSGRKIVFTPFLLFTTYFFITVVPGFVWGMSENGQGLAWAGTIVSSAYLCFLLGFVLVLRTHTDTPVKGLTAAVNSPEAKRSNPVPALIALNILMLILGVILYRGLPAPTQAGMKALMGTLDQSTVSEVGEARRDITKGHIFGDSYQGQGALRELLFNGYLVAVAMAWQHWRIRRDAKSRVLLAITSVMAFILLGGDGTRGPLLTMIVVVVVAQTLLKPITVRGASGAAVLLVVIGVLISSYSPKMYTRIDQEGWLSAPLGIVERISLGNSLNDAFAVRLLDERQMEFGYGRWLTRDFVAALPGSAGGLPLAYELYIRGDNRNRSTTYQSGTLIARGYADLGVVGVGISFLIIGLVCGASELALLSWRTRGTAFRAFLAALFVIVGRGYMTSIVGTLLGVAVLCVIALPFALERRRRPVRLIQPHVGDVRPA